MAGAFDAKVDISTKDARDNLSALRKEVTTTSTTLAALDKALKSTSGDLETVAKSLTGIVAASRAAATATKENAQADIAASRAAAIRSQADAKVSETLARKATQEAQATRATAQTSLASARTAESETRRGIATDRAAQATQRATQAQGQMSDSLSNSRYLMYDVGATYGVLSAALMTIPAATAAVAAAYQKDFAQVVRVNEDFQHSSEAAQTMKDSLKDLAVEMPVAFGDLTHITQLGSQMGIAKEKLAAFTETTAKFVAVSGISADTGATLFGRMETAYTDDVAKYPDFFEKLGSSIAYVGAKTVATDPEIAAMLNQIGPLGAAAGFSADQVVGLSAALASVRVRPELARGALTKVFANINRDVAEGSPRLAEYGKVMGITGDAAAKLWKTDSSKFFTDLVAGLNGTLQKNGELTTTLDKLGIKELRVSDAMTKLAVGNDVLVKSMAVANQGFEEGTALNEMSKPVFETVAAKLTEMASAWQNLGDTLGAGVLGPLALFVDAAKNTAIWLRSISEDTNGVITPLGHLLQLLMGFATVTAVFLGVKAAQAFVMAGMIGFQQAAARGMSGGLGLSNMMRTLAQTMLIAKGATEAESRALLGQVGAMRALTIAATTNGNAVAGTGARHAAAATGVALFARNVRGAGTALLGMVGGPIGLAVGALALLAGGFINASMEAEQAGKTIAEAMQSGADSGRHAIAEALNNRKVQLLPTEGDISFSKLNQSVSEVARQVNVDFKDIVDAIAGGTDSAEKFKQKMVELQKNTVGTDKFKADAYAWLGHVADEMAKSEKTAAAGLKDVAKAAPLAGAGFKDTGEEADKASEDIDKITKALKDLNDEVFGTINAQANLQDALVKIGEGLQKSQSYSPMSEGGRDNLKNVQDALTKARDYYNQLRESDQLSAQEAAQGYADFTSNLMSEIKNKFGGDTSYVSQLAEEARVKFEKAIGGTPVSVPVAVDPAQVAAAATQTAVVAQQTFGNLKTELTVGMDPAEAEQKINQLVIDLARVTGLPQMVIVDALTNPASDKAEYIKGLLKSIENHTYVAPVNANTEPAVKNIQNLQTYAQAVLANIQNSYNQVAASSPTLAKYTKPLFKGVSGVAAPAGIAAPKTTSAPTIAAPAQVKAAIPVDQDKLDAAAQGLGNIGKGYDDAAKKAEKAGKKAKQAAEDMADGITDAVRAAEDYGNRLKTGLMSAYNQQYALTTATDAYHSALNAITKKREDEIKQVEDLRDKIRELNDERDKELITANKAKIEQGISVKYGEMDRAADYGQQAKEALDNAAAKQKEIDTSKKEADTIQAGIGLLTGYSEAAIANREALRNLESKTLDMISAYAAQGHSMDEVRAYAQNLTGQFQRDVGQMGLNQTAVQNLTGDLGRYIDVINRVPEVKPTKVDADTEEATQEMADFGAAADEATKNRTATIDVDTDPATAKLRSLEAQIKGGTDGIGDDVSLTAFRPGSFAPSNYLGGPVKGFAGGGMVPGQSPADPHKDNLMAKVDGKGLIGIRSREWIIPEPAVDYYGPSVMQAIQTMKMPKFAMGGSPSGASGGSGAIHDSVVELGAATLAAMAEMRQEIKLFTDNRTIAESANAGNKQLAAEGHH